MAGIPFDQLGGFYPDDVYDLMVSKLEKPLLSQILKRFGGNQVQQMAVGRIDFARIFNRDNPLIQRNFL